MGKYLLSRFGNSADVFGSISVSQPLDHKKTNNFLETDCVLKILVLLFSCLYFLNATKDSRRLSNAVVIDSEF